MNRDTCFATQGELVKLAYDAFGVLPRKEASRDDVDETQKKSIQKQLIRLAKEEGGLISNLGQAIQGLSNILTAYIPSIQIMSAIGDPLNDLLDAYSRLVSEEGTYLSKAQTVQYFISTTAIPVLVVSLNQSLFRHRLADLKLEMPDAAFWYLPTVAADGSLVLPLEKVMRWVYGRCCLSQTQFHYPGKNPQSDSNTLQQNLDNAIKWTRGVRLPALPALFKNFEESFAALAQNGREVSKELQVSIFVALLIARVSSYLAREITKAYDPEYLVDACQQFREYAVWIADDVDEFRAELAPVMRQQESPESASFVWLSACRDYWAFFDSKLTAVADEVWQLKNARPRAPLREDVLEALKSKYGLFAVCTHLDLLRRQSAFLPPQGFADLLNKGFELKGDVATQLGQVDDYAAQVAAYGLDEQLCWMVPWLRGVYHYRKGQFEAAMPHFQEAFENAKYRAGKNQYKLVNQYVELAAKNDDRRSFKKGIEWAQYLGIKIRWLRDDEPTEEKLDFVYSMLKMARYDHQM
ncbi:hypothetical protein BTW15_28065 [Pseudomonas syringae pv. tomato]|uniref:Tetratricopeptide repeat protein n=4 Tax=Pseudomonas syringae group TaxID=136849 RepID=A0AAW4E7D4_PSESX|nr:MULTISPECIES: hypothetical protein [Pseudomonas syringae group]AVI86119.1 hypothetical protein XJ28_21700 [Pseudomonas syringae pv. tomato]EEB59273.1 hypothetical protein PSPTOT1_4395 [Pseudomonas syringae pv. tomato T1]KGK94289.1 hypothetical protein NB04_17505 [Pseudomonas syringae pv. tomato]KPB78919.1 Uncharacterized protein AC505_0418 [Pseudomonas syringae pv. maculicola]KPW43362.1 Uncharacterized protein ALO86_04736 [Pseudomonas syringae pv. berberidis]